MNFPLLLTPLQISNLNFSNRIVMPPMVTFLAENDGLVNKAHLKHYERSAGPGLIIVEGTAVSPEGRISRKQLGIHSDRHIEGFARLAKTIHDCGAVAGIQIHHAGATAFAETLKKGHKRLSSIVLRLIKQQLVVSDLHRIQKAFENAGRRAVEAGFDIIEIHGAHGYIFSQFLSPLKNWRIDRYGGKIKNRRRFLLEVYRNVYKAVDGKALVTCRLGVADGQSRGLSLSEGLSTASLLEKEGAKLLDVSSGSGSTGIFRPEGSPYSGRLHLAREAKRVLNIPVIGGGGIRYPSLAEQALQDKIADMVFVGRGMLADPAWARKTIEGKSDSIVICRNCRHCFHHINSSKCLARRKKDDINGDLKKLRGTL